MGLTGLSCFLSNMFKESDEAGWINTRYFFSLHGFKIDIKRDSSLVIDSK